MVRTARPPASAARAQTQTESGALMLSLPEQMASMAAANLLADQAIQERYCAV